MDIEIRPIDEAETHEWYTVAEQAFGSPELKDDWYQGELKVFEPERALGVFDDGRLVATTGAYSFDMVLPGGSEAPVAGVTMVTVATSHRRRGILTAMMDRQLSDVAERGEPIAVLNASESHIYGRFGYGPAVDHLSIEVDTREARFVRPVAEQGSFELVDRKEAMALVPGIYDRYRATRAGSMSRRPAWWEIVLGTVETWKGGGPNYTVVHRDAAGEPDGFVLYRLSYTSEHGIQRGSVEIADLAGVDDDVEASLWQYCIDIDLTSWLRAPLRPVDEALRWRVEQPRQVRVVSRPDLLWLRLVDVPAALAARGYGAADALVLEVLDPFRPSNDGRWMLDTRGDAVVCERTAVAADLSLDVSVLGAAYLGGVGLAQLAAARRVDELTDGAVERGHRLFATLRAPHCVTRF